MEHDLLASWSRVLLANSSYNSSFSYSFPKFTVKSKRFNPWSSETLEWCSPWSPGESWWFLCQSFHGSHHQVRWDKKKRITNLISFDAEIQANHDENRSIHHLPTIFSQVISHPWLKTSPASPAETPLLAQVGEPGSGLCATFLCFQGSLSYWGMGFINLTLECIRFIRLYKLVILDD